EQFGPQVLQARLVHESGREWRHQIPVAGGNITVKVRPIREPAAVLVGPSKSFETILFTESRTTTLHRYRDETLAVKGNRITIPTPVATLTVQLAHSGSVRPAHGRVDVGGGGALTVSAGDSITSATEDQTPLQVRTTMPHNLFRQTIRFEISYELH